MASSPHLRRKSGRPGTPPRRLQMRRLPAAQSLLLLWLLATSGACRRRASGPHTVPNLAVAYDMRPISVDVLGTEADPDNATLRRVMHMPAGELAARLGNFSSAAELQLTVQADGLPRVEERIQSGVTWDADGNLAASQYGTRHGFDLLAVAEKAYVRQDKGHFRSKGRRDVEVLELVELAHSGVRQFLRPFGPVRLSDGHTEQVLGRQVQTFAVSPGEAAGERAAAHNPDQPQALLGTGARAGQVFVPGDLPTVPPGAWLQNLAAVSLTGTLSMDKATGVLVRARLQGSLTPEAAARDKKAAGAPALTVRLTLQHDLAPPERVPTVRAPAVSVAEYRRPLRPREPLAFFDGKQNKLPPEAKAALDAANPAKQPPGTAPAPAAAPR